MWIEKHGTVYRIRDEVGGRKTTVQGGIPTKTAAKTILAGLRTDRARGDFIAPTAGRITLNEWLELWWPTYEATLKASSRVSGQGILRRYIRPMLGAYELDDLGPLVVQRWVADLISGKGRDGAKPLAVKTVYNAHGLLHRIMDGAVRQRLIRVNPCERTGLPAKRHHEMLFLTEPQAQRIVAVVPLHYRPLVVTLLGTGLRWGEAIGLRVRDVDVLAGHLRVRVSTQELADTAELVDEEPKTAAGRRTVPFGPAVASTLVPLVSGRDGDDRVFTAPQGGTVRTRVFYGTWDRARKSAGMPRLRVHDLRHTHAAWLISAGVPLTAIQRRLGHKSIAVTSDLYGHLMPEVDERIIRAVEHSMRMINLGGDLGGSSDTQGYQEILTGTDVSRSGLVITA